MILVWLGLSLGILIYGRRSHKDMDTTLILGCLFAPYLKPLECAYGTLLEEDFKTITLLGSWKDTGRDRFYVLVFRLWLGVGMGLVFWSILQASILEGLMVMVFFVGGLAYLSVQEVKKEATAIHRQVAQDLPLFSMRCLLLLEAGMALDVALDYAAEEGGAGRLGHVARYMMKQYALGQPLSKVLYDLDQELADRMVGKFVLHCQQFHQLGSVRALEDLERLQATLWKDQRRVDQLLNKEANVKMVFPGVLMFMGLLMCIMAALVLSF